MLKTSKTSLSEQRTKDSWMRWFEVDEYIRRESIRVQVNRVPPFVVKGVHVNSCQYILQTERRSVQTLDTESQKVFFFFYVCLCIETGIGEHSFSFLNAN